jgi:hypothetical protein
MEDNPSIDAHILLLKIQASLAIVTIHKRRKTKTISRPRASQQYLHQATTIRGVARPQAPGYTGHGLGRDT